MRAPAPTDGVGHGDAATLRVRALLLAVCWFEFERRSAQVASLTEAEAELLVRGARDRACAALLARLGDYRGQSRFAVWAAKFAIRETAEAARGVAAASARKTAAARDTNCVADPTGLTEVERGVHGDRPSRI